MTVATELAEAVLKWWDEHKYDVDSSFDGEFTEEYNRYDEIPEFVVLAARLLGKEVPL